MQERAVQFDSVSEADSNMLKMSPKQRQGFSKSFVMNFLQKTTKRKATSPFLYYTEDSEIFFNPVQQRSAYAQANDVGEALI